MKLHHKYIWIVLYIMIYGCAADIEEYPPKWVVASTYLPRMEGLVHAGFFTMNDAIYSHHCDSRGNMIRLRFDENSKTWKQIKYETFGCGEL